MASLSGKYAQLDSIDIDLTTGRLRLKIDGACPALKKIETDVTTGRLEMDLTGRFDVLKTLDLESTTGTMNVDLSGEWKTNADVRIRTTTGRIRVKLPKDAGVRVDADTTTGKIKTDDLTLSDDFLVNSAYGKSPVTLELKIRTTTGAIDVK